MYIGWVPRSRHCSHRRVIARRLQLHIVNLPNHTLVLCMESCWDRSKYRQADKRHHVDSYCCPRKLVVYASGL